MNKTIKIIALITLIIATQQLSAMVVFDNPYPTIQKLLTMTGLYSQKISNLQENQTPDLFDELNTEAIASCYQETFLTNEYAQELTKIITENNVLECLNLETTIKLIKREAKNKKLPKKEFKLLKETLKTWQAEKEELTDI
ncbi:hypothetical protein KAH94_02960 [bacterium]|nr:hypothetical protein [bacterium]